MQIKAAVLDPYVRLGRLFGEVLTNAGCDTRVFHNWSSVAASSEVQIVICDMSLCDSLFRLKRLKKSSALVSVTFFPSWKTSYKNLSKVPAEWLIPKIPGKFGVVQLENIVRAVKTPEPEPVVEPSTQDMFKSEKELARKLLEHVPRIPGNIKVF